MNRFLIGLVALVLAIPAAAQVHAPVYQDRNGSYQGAQGTWCVNTDGTACPAGTAADPVYTASPSTGAAAQQVQGAQAAATAATVNPVLAGCYGSASAPTSVTTGQMQRDWCGLPGQRFVTLTNTAGSGTVPVSSITNDATAATASLGVFNFGLYFDGTQWARVRGDSSGAVTQPFALTNSRWTYAAAAGGITNTTTAVTIAAAAGASVRNYVASIQCDSDALGAATELAVRDGAGGTVLWRGGISTAGWVNGRDIVFNVPLKGTANTLLELVTLTASVTGSVRCNVQGFTAA